MGHYEDVMKMFDEIDKENMETNGNKNKKSAVDENCHANHRERMRQKVEALGFDALLDHEKLEVILFSIIPRANTNEIAHRLLDRFGSFSAVLDASANDLVQVKGIGRISAFYLSMYSQMVTYYLKDKNQIKPCFDNIDNIGKYVTTKFINCDTEILYCFCLDSKNSLISEKIIQTGTVNHLNIDFGKIATEIYNSKASKFVLAHNHPNGICIPSIEDIDATNGITACFSSLNVELIEHFVVVGDKYVGIRSR